MKKLNFNYWIIIAVMLLAAFTSCKSKGSENVKFETIEVKDGYTHPKSGVKDASIEYGISFTYPSEYSDTAVLKTLQQKFVRYTLSDDEAYFSLTPKEAVQMRIADFKKEYQKEIDELGVKKGEYPFWYIDISNHIVFVNEALMQLLVVCQEGWSFAAHPHTGAACHLFDLNTGKEYKRNDVFKSEAADNIRRLIIADMIKSYEVNEEDFYTDYVWREETNFTVEQDGIHIVYSRGEVGASVLGAPGAVIPYSAILPYLRKDTPVWDFANTVASKGTDSSDSKTASGLVQDSTKKHPIEIQYSKCMGKATSTGDMCDCGYEAEKAWDAELNKNYKALMAKLGKPEQDKLRLAQRKWVEYRDLEFDFMINYYTKDGGTMYNISVSIFRMDFVRERALALKAYSDFFKPED